MKTKLSVVSEKANASLGWSYAVAKKFIAFLPLLAVLLRFGSPHRSQMRRQHLPLRQPPPLRQPRLPQRQPLHLLLLQLPPHRNAATRASTATRATSHG